ncbi:MAG: efflux RND transporter permease subunit [Planctomycetaceae bacterium]|nr:efflux RND transporter permease subunit [Planctomycetaceae bacterium]
MNNLPEFAIRNKSVVVSIVIMLVIAGAYAFQTMPRREDPEFTIMTCTVTTQWVGASAVDVEELITDPLEEVLDGIEEVDVLRSTSTNGLSTIFVDLDESMSPSDVPNVWDKVRARVKNVRMPEQGIVPIVNDEFGDTAVILFAVYQQPADDPDQEFAYRYTDRDLDIYSDRLRDALRLIDGVARVDRIGVQDEAIYVETDAGNWGKLGLTTEALEQLISQRNIIAPGGIVDTSDGRFYVRPGGELNAVDELESVVANVADSGNTANQVYLKDMGMSVRRGYTDPPSLLARYADPEVSEKCVMVSVTMKSGANIVDICDKARLCVERLQQQEKSLPADLIVTPVSDQSIGVNARIQDVVMNVVSAILIVIVIVYLVVGFRTAAVMAANIPFVVLASIGIITLFDVQLEQMSLASMIIALGLLVDNAVQVCDQSRTNQIDGMPPVEATVSGAKMLAIPMLNGTLTTIAAFLPMVIAIEGGSGEFIYSLPVTLSTMLAVSWILAMTFCVILAATFIRPPADPAQPSSPVMALLARFSKRPAAAASTKETNTPGLYERFSLACIQHKFLTLAVAVGLLAATLKLPVGTEFFPQNERDQFAVEVWLPESANIDQTDAAARQVEDLIRKLSRTEVDGQTVERLDCLRTVVGGGGSRWYLSWSPEPRRSNFAEILIRTTDGSHTHSLAADVRRVASGGDKDRGIAPISGVRIVPIELMLGPPADPVTLRVSGNGNADIAQLRQAAEDVKDIIRDQPETWNVHDKWGIDGYELNVNIDEDRANLAGVTNSQVAATLNAYFSGRLLTTFREGDHTVPVYFRLKVDGRRSLADINNAWVEGSSGKVPLGSIADISPKWKPSVIERRDMNRTIEVRARVEEGVSGNDVVNRIMDSAEMKQLEASLPPGFKVEIGGALEESQEAAGMMLMSFVMSLVAIILLLIIQFNSVSKTMIIIGTLPLALIGALGGLALTNNPLGFMPQLGVLSLFGIVLNTGIIFIEFADILIRRKSEQVNGDGPIVGLSAAEFRNCLVDAGKQRLLPIFLTTATTVGGLIPLAMGGGPLWEGMSWLMIFGLLVATLLTLLVVPALYAIVVETFAQPPVEVRKEEQSVSV